MFVIPLNSQTASTGAITGLTQDPSGAVLPRVNVQLINAETKKIRSTVSDDAGRFRILSLPPGNYQLDARKTSFEPYSLKGLRVSVTETLRVDLSLKLAKSFKHIQVTSSSTTVQTDSSAVGRLVNETAITGLPLATRNFSQMVGMSPGVTTGVYNAGELGTGGTALSQIGPSNDGLYVHGGRSYDNNWQLNGISVSDVLSSSSASGGIPIPNPDTIEEFKVQTGLYNAAFGRAAAANISIVTKKGGNNYHGSLFEFLRNELLNANDFFLKEAGQPRPPLKQNQFGFSLGGPIRSDELFFFGSYQGTRQSNGIAAGQARVACTASLHEPPLTDDRSPAALGALFGGMQGALGGVAVSADGSNINPVALALLNLKLPDGSFLIPTPQKIDTSKPLANQGLAVFANPCQFDENQFLANLDYAPSQANQLAARMFISNSDQLVTFPGNGMNPSGNTPGFESPGDAEFLVLSLSHTYVLSSDKLNEARVGFVHNISETEARAPFSWSDVGVPEGNLNRQNDLPTLLILGSLSMAPAFPRTYTQNSLSFSDVFSFIAGAHALQLGGSVTRLRDPLDFSGFNSFLEFLSWPDFLLGLNAAGNGTGMFSNVFESADAFGLLKRDFIAWEASGFLQDDYRVSKRLTLNLGLRYERPGQFGDKLGRNSSFDPKKADANPPPEGSLDGNIVSSRFPGVLPPGVKRVDNTFGTYGSGQNTIAPRFGFAWQILPRTTRLALRGGYGIYYSRPTGQAYTASVLAAPFGLVRTSIGLTNAGASFQTPFAQPFPTADSFPLFVPYSASTKSSVNVLAPAFRPAMAQQFSLNVQAEPKKGWLMEVGYFGVRGTHLQRFRSLNQALDASPNNPIRGATVNTLDNIGLRVPVPGIRPDSLRELESEGSSWYNGLETSLTRRLSHGLQFLASYTFSKTLDSDGANINGTSGVNSLTLGDQNSPAQRWGRASFDRTHRFVFSETWGLPGPPAGIRRALFAGWKLAAVATIQSGSALTIAYTNANNVFGISQDRAQLSGTCSNSQLVRSGSVESKINGYFNLSCFTGPPVIGADGKGTAFGNSGTGIADGPAQANLDVAVSKSIALSWPHDLSLLELRAEFFNALNHPQFSNPDTNFSSPTFGVISSTAVTPRVGQMAVRFRF